MGKSSTELLRSLGNFLAGNKELAEKIKEIKDPKEIEKVLHEAGFELSDEEYNELLKGVLIQAVKDKKLPEEALKATSGGGFVESHPYATAAVAAIGALVIGAAADQFGCGPSSLMGKGIEKTKNWRKREEG
jgi:predicted ribosomally synthesized peptide with nif11-like leader